jgi:hypothetical protein
MRAHENKLPRGSAILSVIARMKAYLCDDSVEEHPAWTGRELGLGLRALGVYYDPRSGEWTLGNGWKKRLASAGLSESATIVDAEKWKRAYRQLCERKNFDPALARIEEAFNDGGKTEAEDNAARNGAEDNEDLEKEKIHRITLKWKFGNV